MALSYEKYKNPTVQHFVNACELLGHVFCKQLGLGWGPNDCWWSGYGGVFCFLGGEMFTNPEDIMLAIEHKMTFEDFSAWYWEWIKTDDDGNPLPGRINLSSWLMGARYNDDTK